ncbi:MAG: thioredoxin family protein [Paludibacter sp.]|nr:thioredoxin family protein [Paludibacter sp.]
MKKIKLLYFITIISSLSAYSQILEPVKWLTSTKITSATTAEITFTATIDNGWHIYAMDMSDDGPIPTTFKFEIVKGGKVVGKIQPKSTLKKEYDPYYEMELRWYDLRAIFVQQIEFADAQKVDIQGNIHYMACNDKSCVPPTYYNFEIKKLDASAFANSSEKANIVKETIVETAPAAVDTATIGAVTIALTDENSNLWKPVVKELNSFEDTHHSLLWIFLFGILAGFLALFTPCVWPIIPMTVSYFLKRSGEKRRGRRDAILYGLSIIIIYVALGLIITAIFGGNALNAISTSWQLNVFLFLLLVVFAISFLGAFEITLPSSWTTKLDNKAENTAGFLGILMMAFVLALVSFSCTGPIIGGLLASLSTTGDVLAPALGMLGFAIALAIPFTFFAFFPSLLKSLPKSGGWLNTVKVVLAFIELAFALKFLSVADLAYDWRILDRETFLALWIVIFALLGFYLLGKIRFPHDSEQKHTSIFGLFSGMISLAFALYMLPGLWGAPLTAISAFPPPLRTQDFNLYKSQETHAKFTDYDAGMSFAAEHKKPVVIDFTGFGCVNCRKMEASVWIDPRVKNMLDNDFVLISLWVDDKTPLTAPYEVTENGKSVKIKTAGDKWSYLQRMKFGANAQPYYVILDNQGNPLAKKFTFNENIDKFIEWLRIGRASYK